MKFKLLMVMALPLVLLSGCGTTIAGDTYCDISQPIWFEGQGVIDNLSVADPQLLRQIVQHNETVERLCS